MAVGAVRSKVYSVCDIGIVLIHKRIIELVFFITVAVGAVAGIAAIDYHVVSWLPVVRDLCRLAIDDVTVLQYHL